MLHCLYTKISFCIKLLSLATLLSSSSFATPIQKLPKLKFGLIYSGDSFVVSWIKTHEIDKKFGFDLEIVNFLSTLERDAALQGKSIDAMNGDLVGASLMHQRYGNIHITNQTLGGGAFRMAAIIAAPKYKGSSLADLKGKQLGISPNTVIEYLADRMLKRNGLDPNAVEKSAVTNIPLRLSLVQGNKLDMGLLPEPLASVGLLNGAHLVADDVGSHLSHAVLIFHDDVLNKRTAVAGKFMQALAQATKMINTHPENYRHAMAERCRVPEAVKSTFTIYKFNLQQAPTKELYDDVQNWLLETGKIAKAIPYNHLVDQRFLRSKAS